MLESDSKAPQLEHSMGSPCDDVFLTGGCYISVVFFPPPVFLSCSAGRESLDSYVRRLSVYVCARLVIGGSSGLIGIEINLHDNNSLHDSRNGR